MMNGFNNRAGISLKKFHRTKRGEFSKCVKSLISNWSTELIDEENEGRNKSINENLILQPGIDLRKWSIIVFIDFKESCRR